jgi:hypothetical protein
VPPALGPGNPCLTYDGLHPNNIGEWMIADAFANALARDFGFGRGSAYLPAPTTDV